MDKIKVLRRNKLIKKLFEKTMSLNNDVIKTPCKLRIQAKGRISGQAKYTYKKNTGLIFKTSVVINPKMIKLWDIKKGYNNGYYNNRHEKLNFIIGNYKKALRFVILHEIGHIKFYNKYGISIMNKTSLKRLEKYADGFALRYINEI